MSTLDVFDTSRCPVGHRCEACGSDTDGLRVAAVETALGVLCLTMCPACSGSGVDAPLAVTTAVRLVAQHCAHLGIAADEMAAALDELGRDGGVR